VLIDADQSGAHAPDAAPVAVVARALGNATNNFAEYTAVILALRRAHELGADEVEVVLAGRCATRRSCRS
jgi:ribonuclease HI